VSKRLPGVILKFGGHAMAAGLTIREDGLNAFTQAFDLAVRELSGKDSFDPTLQADGSLPTEHATVETAKLLADQVWGAGFPPPAFLDNFIVRSQSLLKEKHLKLRLE